MAEYISDTKVVPYSDSTVFGVLSDLRNLQRVDDLFNTDKIKEFSFDADTVSFRVDPMGKITFRVVERDPNKLVKFKSEYLPFDIFLWVQLVNKAEAYTRLRVTVTADLNPFVKGMVDKPMREVVEKISDALSQLPYDQF